MSDAKSLKILIADDNSTDRLILQTIVKRQGYRVVTAVDGQDAIDCYEREQPQLVLLDALMPRKDGFEAARVIRKLAGEDLVPIIFLTSLSDAESLAKCLEAGGDDFLSKPYNQIILQAKINAHNRMRLMHKTVQQQRDQIAEHNQHMLHEQKVARDVFDNVAHLGCLNAANIKHLLSPLSVFNGDVLLACLKPSGGMHVLLGDFTGHGLPAAIGAMPLAEIFYGMTLKGFAMTDVLREVNQKLQKILPVGFFCCACMVELNFDRREIEVWMGGLPDCYLIRGYELLKLRSNHLPLGVLNADQFKTLTQKFEMEYGDRVLLWSDGIIEATNAEGDMFGEDRLHSLLEAHDDHDTVFEEIRDRVTAYVGEDGPQDDLTLVEVRMVPESELGIQETILAKSALRGPRNWKMSYQIEGETLREFDPIPLLLHMILEVPGLRPFNGQIFTILSELYSNALEHGILKLSSDMKMTSNGFAEYYFERDRRLKNIADESILFELSHRTEGRGGVLSFRVEDSGEGFEFENVGASLPPAELLSGRGIPMLRSMCRRLEYTEPGNIVEAEFAWQP